ncbi:MAG: restriction endonuclease subunit R [Flavobacteriales bacterium]|nr:MAG: restriction endonuclease subunit R [Flavobacteriales bacterium]
MNPITPLNLPQTKLHITKKDEQLYVSCIIRKKSVVLSPEEWVRQHLIAYFTEKLDYPRGLIGVEKQIKYGELDKRWDVAVFKTDQSCFMLLECKAPNINITKAVLEQSLIYYKELQSEYLALSNGIEHFIMKKNRNSNEFEKIDFFPPYV